MSRITQVQLNEIRHVSQSELNSQRLYILENGIKSFEETINNTSDIITLEGSKPYDIIDGRHRIFLARKRGLKSVKALIQ